jgi:type III secretion protein T
VNEFGFDAVGNFVAGMALTVPRIAAAFLILPLLTEDDMPALVRNSFFVSLAVMMFPLVGTAEPMTALQPAQWFWLVLKEAFIGTCIGFLFGTVFWAIGQVGSVIDTKVGATQGMLSDPLTGHQDSLNAVFLSRFASWLFMAAGGFLIFLELLLTSYSVWPVYAPFPELNRVGEMHVINAFDKLMILTLVLSAPALIILAMVDVAIGLINRYAPQLNVLALSMALKGWISAWIVLLCLGVFAETITRTVAENRGLITLLRHILPTAPSEAR